MFNETKALARILEIIMSQPQDSENIGQPSRMESSKMHELFEFLILYLLKFISFKKAIFNVPCPYRQQQNSGGAILN